MRGNGRPRNTRKKVDVLAHVCGRLALEVVVTRHPDWDEEAQEQGAREMLTQYIREEGER